ncbi:MAG TPA: HAD family phosphatase [Candidatus Thermoplasmatota archaeon]|nr:HAD family phosphatase [Candidatus Thermoplasmatota archaeon]
MPTPTHRSAREDPLAIADGWLQVVSARQASPREDARRPDAPLDLVIFDMDGTLVDASSWEIVHAAHGVSNDHNWRRYQRGELDDVEFMRSDIALWHVGGREVHVEDVARMLERAPLMPGAREVVAGLRARGVATCILSGGIDLLARRVCLDLGIDMYVANGLRLRESGHLQGDGIPFVEIRDKGRTAREILRKLGVPRERAAAVGNSAYDVPMFEACAFGVAFDPADPAVRRAARFVVEGKDMRPVLDRLLGS